MTTKPRGNFFIPGINNDDWFKRAEKWCGRHDVASKSQDYVGSFLANWFVEHRVGKMTARLQSFAMRHDTDVFAHSHGCRRGPIAIGKGAIPVRDLHLIAPACSESFSQNKLNLLMYRALVRDVYVYCSDDDEALRQASRWFGMKLGFDDMGRVGPDVATILPEFRSRVVVVRIDWMRHSTWLRNAHLVAILNGEMAREHGVRLG